MKFQHSAIDCAALKARFIEALLCIAVAERIARRDFTLTVCGAPSLIERNAKKIKNTGNFILASSGSIKSYQSSGYLVG